MTDIILWQNSQALIQNKGAVGYALIVFQELLDFWKFGREDFMWLILVTLVLLSKMSN